MLSNFAKNRVLNYITFFISKWRISQSRRLFYVIINIIWFLSLAKLIVLSFYSSEIKMNQLKIPWREKLKRFIGIKVKHEICFLLQISECDDCLSAFDAHLSISKRNQQVLFFSPLNNRKKIKKNWTRHLTLSKRTRSNFF